MCLFGYPIMCFPRG